MTAWTSQSVLCVHASAASWQVLHMQNFRPMRDFTQPLRVHRYVMAGIHTRAGAYHSGTGSCLRHQQQGLSRWGSCSCHLLPCPHSRRWLHSRDAQR